MPNYKDQNNQIHFLDSAEHSHLLPQGCVEITDVEAEAIKASSIIPPTHQQLRAAEYPSITMYLDGVVKGDEAQKQAYIDACLAVKAKYPKL